MKSKLAWARRKFKMASYTGEQPRKGTYKCKNCGNICRLDQDKDRLPPCGKCHKTKFKKLVWPALLWNLMIGHEDMTASARAKSKEKARKRREKARLNG